MSEKEKTYYLATSRHDCVDRAGHSFVFIRDSKIKTDIRKQHPNMILPLWKCRRCGKITQSM